MKKDILKNDLEEFRKILIEESKKLIEDLDHKDLKKAYHQTTGQPPSKRIFNGTLKKTIIKQTEFLMDWGQREYISYETLLYHPPSKYFEWRVKSQHDPENPQRFQTHYFFFKEVELRELISAFSEFFESDLLKEKN